MFVVKDKRGINKKADFFKFHFLLQICILNATVRTWVFIPHRYGNRKKNLSTAPLCCKRGSWRLFSIFPPDSAASSQK